MPEENKISVGGQALMEGVMMNGPKGVAMALRLPDGRIETQLKEAHFLKDKYKFARIPATNALWSRLRKRLPLRMTARRRCRSSIAGLQTISAQK